MSSGGSSPSPSTSLSLSDAKVPHSILQGNSFSIGGTVQSSSPLEYVGIEIKDYQDKTVLSAKSSPYTTSYNLKGLDNSVKFGSLSSGYYVYQVEATNTQGTFKVLYNGCFYVYNQYKSDFYASIFNYPAGKYTEGTSNNFQLASGANNDDDLRQIWHFMQRDDGSYGIYNCYTGRALGVSGSNVVTLDQPNVGWYMIFANGYNTWMPSNDKRVMDLTNNSSAPGTNIQLYERNGTGAQNWAEKVYLDMRQYSLDVNGTVDGSGVGNLSGVATFDIYVNGQKVGSNVSDYYNTSVLQKSTYEIKNIRPTSAYTYTGSSGNALSGSVKGNTDINLHFTKKQFTLSLSSIIDGSKVSGLGSAATADVYINGSLAASNCSSYTKTLPYGTTYEIRNIRTASGYTYNGVASGSLSGTLTSSANVQLSFTRNQVTLNLSSIIDGTRFSGLGSAATADIYINGSLVASGCSSFSKSVPYGAAYEIKNIQASAGYVYRGVSVGSLSGTITGNTNVELTLATRKFKISYSANGGSNAPSNQTKKYGQNITLRAAVPTRNGYTFAGWATTANASTAQYQPGDVYTANKALNLYAVWTANNVGGSCGTGVKWKLNRSNGNLAITGSGKMKLYASAAQTPWYQYRSEIKSITVANSVTRIGDFAFAGLTSLTKVTINGQDPLTIGDYAFKNCSNLSQITLRSGTNYLGEGAFFGCTNLVNVKIPASVQEIDSYAFKNCTNLTSVSLPAKVTRISKGTFTGCKSLTSISLPRGITSIENSAFASCSRLSRVTYNGTRNQWSKIRIGENNKPLTNAKLTCKAN